MNEEILTTCLTCTFYESWDSSGGWCRYNTPVIAVHLIHANLIEEVQFA
jgi:hypothetical protein